MGRDRNPPVQVQENDVVLPLHRTIVRFIRNEDGPTAVEYAVMLALIIVVCIAAVTALGTNANNTYTYVATKAKPTGS